MRYVVEWVPVAVQRLAEIWVRAKAQAAVTRAANELDDAQATRPLRLGESRTSSVDRTAFAPPLGIEFTVIEDEKRFLCWKSGRHRKPHFLTDDFPPLHPV
jgi:hypothetical protein